jgi:CheY-like chemotaxis protein
MPILIVDDEPDIRLLLRELLMDEGYTVAHAANGREALTYLHSAPIPPCVIILDLMMPIMSGWDFLRTRQNDPRVQTIPVVVLSATLALAPAAALGAQVCLAKPIDLDRFVATIQCYCLGAPPS